MARAADERLRQLAEDEARDRAELAQIARENRAALLAGRPGVKQGEALRRERAMRQRRAQMEARVVDHALERAARILTREQFARACLLTLGEPVRDRDRAVSAALLDPLSGFVLVRPNPDPPADPLQAVRDHVEQLRSRWTERRDAAARQLLARRYPPEVLDSAFGSGRWQHLFIDSSLAEVEFVNGEVLRSKLHVEGDSADPQVAAALRELEALRAGSVASVAQLFGSAERLEDLLPALRPFIRRTSLSPRLRPVLEEATGSE